MNQSEVKKLLRYENGRMYWEVNRSGVVGGKGKRAGSYDRYGYRRIGINGKSYREHQIVYLYHYGIIPKCIDHINHQKDDNRIENLRAVTYQLNTFSRGMLKNNKTGYRGVTFNRSVGKYQAAIGWNGRVLYLGCFLHAEDAASAYRAKAEELYPSQEVCP